MARQDGFLLSLAVLFPVANSPVPQLDHKSRIVEAATKNQHQSNHRGHEGNTKEKPKARTYGTFALLSAGSGREESRVHPSKIGLVTPIKNLREKTRFQDVVSPSCSFVASVVNLPGLSA
jgi:hypothetical protein